MTLKDDLREYRRKLAELERLERTDTLPDEPYREKCSLCHFNAREVRDLCGQCWRAHEARQHELDYERAQEDADA